MASGEQNFPAIATDESMTTQIDSFKTRTLANRTTYAGSAAPTDPDEGQLWADTDQMGVLRINHDNNGSDFKIASAPMLLVLVKSSGPYNILYGDGLIVVTGVTTVNLPVNDANAHPVIVLKNEAANTVTVGRNGATIDNVASDKSMTSDLEMIMFVPDQSGNWVTAALH
jgi:hypothetical protein